MSDTASTPRTPAQRHVGRPRPDHILYAPLRRLLPGDVTVHNDGSESVIIANKRLPQGEYLYATRTLRPPAQEARPRPAEYWLAQAGRRADRRDRAGPPAQRRAAGRTRRLVSEEALGIGQVGRAQHDRAGRCDDDRASLPPRATDTARQHPVQRSRQPSPVRASAQQHRPRVPDKPLPSAFTDSRSSHPVAFTQKVPLLLRWI
ncbi:hypothetical protein BX285_6961 [Streptomyces sp. 1114.5]|uniref:hypothetical protein n=1 Tax=Streptomyces sp. 1114.5 TaxID=1938830 RepID=UPI000F22F73A|nr:hypothetical protein [Streptomyces sp. 1114.5]RKT09852.1 hypothetical protein BX285_6961 [Streptomyces sp. 1114.5]